HRVRLAERLDRDENALVAEVHSPILCRDDPQENGPTRAYPHAKREDWLNRQCSAEAFRQLNFAGTFGSTEACCRSVPGARAVLCGAVSGSKPSTESPAHRLVDGPVVNVLAAMTGLAARSIHQPS